MSHPLSHNLLELRHLLDTKAISSVELTQSYLDRIAAHNPELNAYISVTSDSALAQAAAADAFMAAGDSANSPLCGIPYAAKDLFCTAGLRTTAASRILDNYVPPHNSTVIQKLVDGHAVLLGKTNMDQFAHGSSGETSAYGPTKNPWDTTRMPGGSSSGSAAAVVAGLAPWALATETGGSIRQPAALTGVTGWKPTYGRVSRYGVIAMASSLDSMGAMAGSVAELAQIATLISGQDLKDSTTGHHPVPNFHAGLTGDIRGLRIGIPKEYFVDGMEPGVRAAVELALSELEKLGAKLVEVSLPKTKYGSLVYAIVCPSEVSSNLSRYDGIRYGHVAADATDLFDVYAQSRAEGFGDEAKRRIMIGTYALSAGYYDAYYKKAQAVRRLIMQEFDEVFTQVDVLAAASSPNVALPLGKAADDPLFGYIADQLNIPSSLAGLPAVALPCGFAPAQGNADIQLPVGLQLIGPQWSESTLFQAGYAYQQVSDWHTKRPQNFN